MPSTQPKTKCLIDRACVLCTVSAYAGTSWICKRIASPRITSDSCRAVISMWSMSGNISRLDKADSLTKRTRRSWNEAGNALFEATDSGYQCKSRPCVPLAKRLSTAMFDTSMHLIMWLFLESGLVSLSGCQSPARCKVQRACVLTFLRMTLARWSLKNCPLAPLARQRALILREWFCTYYGKFHMQDYIYITIVNITNNTNTTTFAIRRTTVRFHLSLYRLFGKTLVLPSNSTCSAQPMRAPLT